MAKVKGRIKPDSRGLETRWTWKKRVVSKEYSQGFKFNGWVNNKDINKDLRVHTGAKRGWKRRQFS